MCHKLGLTFLAFTLAGPAYAQTSVYSTNQPTLTYEGAEKVLQIATEVAKFHHAPSDFAVVDRAGDLVAFKRMNGAWLAGISLAIGKAKSAARYQRPTEVLEQAINNGRLAAITAGTTEMQGGVPIIMNGVVIGALGVSGFDKNNDVTIADAASKLQ
jgi:glc operon protein GlcG